MAKKVKLKRNNSATQGENESIAQFVVRTTEVVDESATIDASESEVTTLENLNLMRSYKQIDDRAYRSGLRRLEDNAGGFANLTSNEKTEVARRFATDHINVVSEFPSFWDRVWNGYSDFHSPQVEARSQRFKWCAALIYNSVLPNASGVIIGKMITNGYHTTYIDFGTESLADDGVEGLLDYTKSAIGTSKVGAGLLEDATGNMIPGTITELELIQKINDCLELGILYKP